MSSNNSKLRLPNLYTPVYYPRTAVAQWLRCCATNRKVAGLIGIFH